MLSSLASWLPYLHTNWPQFSALLCPEERSSAKSSWPNSRIFIKKSWKRKLCQTWDILILEMDGIQSNSHTRTGSISIAVKDANSTFWSNFQSFLFASLSQVSNTKELHSSFPFSTALPEVFMPKATWVHQRAELLEPFCRTSLLSPWLSWDIDLPMLWLRLESSLRY